MRLRDKLKLILFLLLLVTGCKVTKTSTISQETPEVNRAATAKPKKIDTIKVLIDGKELIEGDNALFLDAVEIEIQDSKNATYELKDKAGNVFKSLVGNKKEKIEKTGEYTLKIEKEGKQRTYLFKISIGPRYNGDFILRMAQLDLNSDPSYISKDKYVEFKLENGKLEAVCEDTAKKDKLQKLIINEGTGLQVEVSDLSTENGLKVLKLKLDPKKFIPGHDYIVEIRNNNSANKEIITRTINSASSEEDATFDIEVGSYNSLDDNKEVLKSLWGLNIAEFEEEDINKYTIKITSDKYSMEQTFKVAFTCNFYILSQVNSIFLYSNIANSRLLHESNFTSKVPQAIKVDSLECLMIFFAINDANTEANDELFLAFFDMYDVIVQSGTEYIKMTLVEPKESGGADLFFSKLALRAILPKEKFEKPLTIIIKSKIYEDEVARCKIPLTK